MILKRYGTAYHSVDMDFDAKALNDVGFMRNRRHSVPADDLHEGYETVQTFELTAEADGPVQYETKQLLLDRLRDQVEALVQDLPEGGLLVVENASGHDYPKTRQDTRNVVEGNENRLYFEYTLSPPLRISLRKPAT